MTTPKHHSKNDHPFDEDTRPQDNFFGYVNNKWIAANPIPDDKSRWGIFDSLREKSLQDMHQIYKNLDDSHQSGTIEQQARDFYFTVIHMDDFEQTHLQELKEYIAKIEAITDVTTLSACIGELQAAGVQAAWGAWVGSDDKDSTKRLIEFGQSGLTLPNRDYYLSDDAKMKTIRKAYKAHLAKVHTAFPYVAEGADAFSAAVIGLETQLATHSRPDADLRDVERNYNKTPFATLQQKYDHIDWHAYATALGWHPSDQINVGQPEFLAFVDSLFVPDQLENWKTYLKWQFIVHYYGKVSESFAELKFSFFGKILGGVKELPAKWKRAVAMIDDAIGEGVGKLYAKHYFPESAKQQMADMVQSISDTYAARIKKLDWMDETTKKYALKKLANTKVLIGYPDKWRDYADLHIGRTSLIANAIAAEKFDTAYHMDLLQQPNSRDQWLMYPQTVNAYSDPHRLVICFPAAILQPPFFDPKAPLAVNLGGIGTVIGHELTHGFDDQGCQFDAEGNVRQWQTDADRKAFSTRADLIIKQADAYEVLPGLHLQGNLVIGESIADLGGIEIAYEALIADHKVTDEDKKLFFTSYATTEGGATREEKRREYALTDPHPDGEFRVNGILQHVDGFYEAFELTKGDTLFRDEAKRARIW
ncbi:MAG TPA: M13 family metallopeptidase [Candidatus Saccharimonadales bacterium]|nr:M13 family metallopeptidase [Candidatus Saccharimonadales bacterium]